MLPEMATASAIFVPRSSLGKICRLTEAGVAELEPVRVPRAVAHDVGAVLAARVLLRRVAGAGRRRDDVRRAQRAELHRTGRQQVERLQHDLGRLADLVDAHLVAVEHVAVLAQADLEVELGIDRVGPRAAQVVSHSRGARVGTGDAVVGDVFLGHDALAHAALQEDGVVVDERLVLGAPGRHLGHELAALLDPAVGQVVAHAAEAEVVEHHARAADRLEQVEDLLAVAERVEDQGRAQGREVGGERADADLVAGDAVELGHDHADDFGAARGPDAGELLDRHDVAPLAVHAGDVLGAVDDRDVLVVGALLGDLLFAAMQVADHRDDVFDELAVEGDDEAQHAVRRGMLRPHVDDDLVEAQARHLAAPACRLGRGDAPQSQGHGFVGGRYGEGLRHAGGSRRSRRSLCAAGGRPSRR